MAIPKSIRSARTIAARSSCTGPRACYDEGKRAAETLAFDFCAPGRAEVRVARIFNTYGPRMRGDDGRVVSNLIMPGAVGRDITIYGDGSQTRSFCYVDDMVEGLSRLMSSDRAVGMPVNLGNPERAVDKGAGRPGAGHDGQQLERVYRPFPEDDPRRRKPDIGRARDLLDWRPTVDLEQGLKATIEWFTDEANQSPSPCTSMPR